MAITPLLALPAGATYAQSAIKMDSAGASTVTQTAGVHVLSLPVTMRNSTDNPTGTTFAAVSPGPVPVVTYTLSNQQYAVSNASSSTQVAAFIGSSGPGTSITARSAASERLPTPISLSYSPTLGQISG